MDSLHRYLMARHHVDNYADYMALLAMYRNTAAIEAIKAHTHRMEIDHLIEQVNVIRSIVIRRFVRRRNTS